MKYVQFTLKTRERRSGVFIVNSNNISQVFLVFLLLTLITENVFCIMKNSAHKNNITNNWIIDRKTFMEENLYIDHTT